VRQAGARTRSAFATAGAALLRMRRNTQPSAMIKPNTSSRLSKVPLIDGVTGRSIVVLFEPPDVRALAGLIIIGQLHPESVIHHDSLLPWANVGAI
jgi:hypothetical protein